MLVPSSRDAGASHWAEWANGVNSLVVVHIIVDWYSPAQYTRVVGTYWHVLSCNTLLRWLLRCRAAKAAEKAAREAAKAARLEVSLESGYAALSSNAWLCAELSSGVIWCSVAHLKALHLIQD
jgi:hypothetical protein